MHQNGLSYLIIELEDSGQPVQGIQPKNNNKGNPQMFGKRLSTLWICPICPFHPIYPTHPIYPFFPEFTQFVQSALFAQFVQFGKSAQFTQTTLTTLTNQNTQTTFQLAFQNMLSTWKFVNL